MLAFSPERVDPGRIDHTTKTVPKVVGGINEASTEAAAELYGSAIDSVHRVSTPEAAELDQAAREHLSLGQHRARQRARTAVRPHGDRHLGGRRRGGDEAVRLHALRAGARPRRPLHPDRSLLSDLEGARVRLLDPLHRARRRGQPEHALLLPLTRLAGAEPRGRQVAQGLTDPRPRGRLQGRHLRPPRVTRRQADRAPAERGSGRLLPRPARAHLRGGGHESRVATTRSRCLRRSRDRDGPYRASTTPVSLPTPTWSSTSGTRSAASASSTRRSGSCDPGRPCGRRRLGQERRAGRRRAVRARLGDRYRPRPADGVRGPLSTSHRFGFAGGGARRRHGRSRLDCDTRAEPLRAREGGARGRQARLRREAAGDAGRARWRSSSRSPARTTSC